MSTAISAPNLREYIQR